MIPGLAQDDQDPSDVEIFADDGGGGPITLFEEDGVTPILEEDGVTVVTDG